MCSFGSCQTRFEFLSQFRKVRNAFECFVAQVQTRLPKTKRVWPMKINVICTVAPAQEQVTIFGPIAQEYHRKFSSKEGTDKTFLVYMIGMVQCRDYE